LKVTEATITVTNRCNLRCQICDIWQIRDNHLLLPEDYHKLPSTLTQINLEGGEPFLRKDLLEIIEVLKSRCPKAGIKITTNGVLTRVIEEKVKRMPEVVLMISINGPEKVHDRISGVKGAYQKGIETIKRLKSLGIRDLSIRATASKLNQETFFEVKKLADQFEIGFNCGLHNLPEITFGDQKDLLPHPPSIKKELEKTRDSYLKKFKPEEWLRAYFVEGLIDSVEGRPRAIRCTAGSNSFFLQPNGDIYPCKVLNLKMGNIKEGGIEEIMENSEHIKETVKLCPHQCWMSSNMTPLFKRNPIKPLCWALSHKFKFELLKFLGNSTNGNK